MILGRKTLFEMHDRRAFLGGLSLLMAGFVLAVMLTQYLNLFHGATFSRSRLWWEVAMNVQILSIALMWYCYMDRIEDSSGVIKGMHKVRLVFGLYGVCVPLMLVVIVGVLPWFRVPDAHTIILIVFSIYLVLQLGILLEWQMRRRVYANIAGAQNLPFWPKLTRLSLYFAPTILMFVTTILCWDDEDSNWIILMPVFIYIQGALPFFLRAFGRT